MKSVKLVLLASAAAMLIGTGSASAAHLQYFAGTSPTLCMPQRTVAAGQALSPYAVATRLSARHYRVQSMHRHGSAYAVRATGPHGSTVDMMVDGGSGTIIGLTVLAAATGNVISAMTAQNAVYVDDLHPFGAVVPEVVYDFWDNIAELSWEVASAETVSVAESYAAFRSAVPFNFVHMGHGGRSVALAPPRYRGFRLTNSRGQALRSPLTRSDAAYEEAAYQSERANQAEFDKQMAQEDAADANQNADDLQRENDALSNEVISQSQHADDVEQKNAELQQQLNQNGTANEVDNECAGGGCDATQDYHNYLKQNGLEEPDNGGSEANQERGGDCMPGEARCDGHGDTAAAPEDQGGAPETGAAQQTDEGSAAPADNGGDQQQAEPQQEPQQEAAPQDEGGNDQQQQSEPEQGGGDDQQSAPDDFGGNDQGGGDDNGGDGDGQ